MEKKPYIIHYESDGGGGGAVLLYAENIDEAVNAFWEPPRCDGTIITRISGPDGKETDATSAGAAVSELQWQVEDIQRQLYDIRGELETFRLWTNKIADIDTEVEAIEFKLRKAGEIMLAKMDPFS